MTSYHTEKTPLMQEKKDGAAKGEIQANLLSVAQNALKMNTEEKHRLNSSEKDKSKNRMISKQFVLEKKKKSQQFRLFLENVLSLKKEVYINILYLELNGTSHL